MKVELSCAQNLVYLPSRSENNERHTVVASRVVISLWYILSRRTLYLWLYLSAIKRKIFRVVLAGRITGLFLYPVSGRISGKTVEQMMQTSKILYLKFSRVVAKLAGYPAKSVSGTTLKNIFLSKFWKVIFGSNYWYIFR